MRSRAVRLTLSAVAWIALGAAAVFLVQSERHLGTARAALRAFDQRVRETTDALADLRSAEQAYVAAGQGVAFWMPKVAALSDTVGQHIAALRELGASAGRPAVDEAARTFAAFADIDKRTRGYITGGQQLMAADVIFTEGGETAVATARALERGRVAEHLAVDATEGALRRQEAAALGAAAGVAAVVILLLFPRAKSTAEAAGEAPATASLSIAPTPTQPAELMLRSDGSPQPSAYQVASTPTPARNTSPALKDAALLCTALGRVSDAEELRVLLGRAADLLDASGIVVWLGSTAGADLRPAIAHGYGPQALARMPVVARSADNAAAAAYRTGELQIVLARPGASAGAIVAPLLASDGCVGALSAEIRGGGEASDAVQALAAIVAAQLAGILATTAEAHQQRAVSG